MTTLDAHPRTSDGALWDLEELARARRLCDWMLEQFAPRVGPSSLEVGAGIGTFSERLLERGVERLLLVEPEDECVSALRRRFGGDPRVTVAGEELPGAPSLVATRGEWDFVLCQNVLEHIADDRAAVRAMAGALRPDGRLTILVPAHPRLFGSLDAAFGHHRRYTPERLREVVEGAGLVVEDLYAFNLLGIAGWWMKNRRSAGRIGAGSLRAYEALVRLWRPLERRMRLPWGLSLIAHARKPDR
jgi:SAM-dependent methyltransferase